MISRWITRCVDEFVFTLGVLAGLWAVLCSVATFVDDQSMLLNSLASFSLGTICFIHLRHRHPESWRFYFIAIGGPSLIGTAPAVHFGWSLIGRLLA